MGNKLLITLLFTLALLANSQFKGIDDLIVKIKQKRVGLSPIVINNIPNPFVDEKKLNQLAKKNKILTKRRHILRLYAIFQDRAKINGRWYTIGSKIGSYTIRSIKPDKGVVYLLSKHRTVRLYLQKKKSKNIIIRTKKGS
ncbi:MULTISPECIES: hypothetical protein [unclassified Nitratiruptor]|uniref:hypothetical protein n=1 Tax=unclassified Nitratiruptor TaxID=2624044 RepID=UPI00191667D8|nr:MULTISPECIES: hypothetical protein [unclassified Nitratiruptor]BCD60280.1 hypothetical protein NitYY0810_C1045 [Nitratiruptor sp. YY08-10]BCD64231.1 hypothetical protein NitYY0814_C1076 [Nitratiruptor sp. YY08-14]